MDGWEYRAEQFRAELVRRGRWESAGVEPPKELLREFTTRRAAERVAALLRAADGLARDLRIRFPKAQLFGDDAGFAQSMARVLALVEAPRLGLDLPLDVQGTAFQQRVWQALGEIPAGRTASYAEVARRIGAPRATRAVAQACAANPLAVVIPCHRVVKSDGALSGYRWGIERKRVLLEREAGR